MIEAEGTLIPALVHVKEKDKSNKNNINELYFISTDLYGIFLRLLTRVYYLFFSYYYFITEINRILA